MDGKNAFTLSTVCQKDIEQGNMATPVAMHVVDDHGEGAIRVPTEIE